MLNYSQLLPKRALDTNKHNCGRVGVIAGSENMLGASILTSLAVLRSGAGLIYLMTTESAKSQINLVYPEIIVLPLKSKNGVITEKAFNQIKKYHNEKNFSSLAIGPGLTTNKSIQTLISKIVVFAEEKQIPTVLDADAINVLTPEIFAKLTSNLFVLTPHWGEFKRFFGLGEQKNNLYEQTAPSVNYFAKKINQIIVLKGHNSIIADSQTLNINPTGNPGLATAGTGDILTGIIAGLIAQGVKNYDSALLGTYLHGLSADIAIKDKTVYSLIASDLLNYLPLAFKKIC